MSDSNEKLDLSNPSDGPVAPVNHEETAFDTNDSTPYSTQNASNSTLNSVRDAVSLNDWNRLRELSLQQGGFGNDRVLAWPFLLGVPDERPGSETKEDSGDMSQTLRRRRVTPNSSSSSADLNESSETGALAADSSTIPHPDEHQIKLDTDRSFVLYPVVEHHTNREELQSSLNQLITSVFRRRPRLSYFQGFHDIITVLFLTLPEELQLVCAEKISLHRLRDAMGKGLEPMVGLLRILKYLFRLADPAYAEVLEENTPLPYFALSNLLTLFSHDVPTLAQIQHVFDYLLSRPPIATVYLVAAVTLARKEEAMRMVEDDEDGMLHSLLTTLPELEDGEKELVSSVEKANADAYRVLDGLGDSKFESSSEPKLEGDASSRDTDSLGLSEEFDDYAGNFRQISLTKSETKPAVDADDSTEHRTQDVPSGTGTEDSSMLSSACSTEPEEKKTEVDPPVPTRSSTPHSDPTSSISHLRKLKSKPTTSLTTLLQHADSLFAQFPPTHPDLHVAEIMGPKSVIFTWHEPPPGGFASEEDDAAEGMVGGEGIVLEYADSEAEEEEEEEEEWDEITGSEKTEQPPQPRRPRRLVKRRPPPTRPRRACPSRLRKTLHRLGLNLALTHPLILTATDKKTVATGAVLVLGVAIAVYSMQARGARGGLLEMLGGERGRGDGTGGQAGKWIVGVLLGGSERVLETFGWMR